MRKVLLALLLLTSVVVIIGVKSRMAARLSTSIPNDKQQETTVSPLTKAEESDLITLTGRTLVRDVTWNPQPTNCPRGNEIEAVDLVKQYRKYEGLEIHATRIIRERWLTVYLSQFHTWLSFRRFHHLGLGPPLVGYFCENSYEEYIAAEEQRLGQAGQISEEIIRRAEADSQMGEILRKLKEEDFQRTESSPPRHEVWRYRVPSLVERIVELDLSWSEEKKHLYERIIAVVRKEVENFHCVPGKNVQAIVPDFDVGDPDIFVLVEAPQPYGKSVEWIRFDRDPPDGKYNAYHAKSHELWPSEADAPKDLLRLRDLIRRKKVKLEKMVCPNR